MRAILALLLVAWLALGEAALRVSRRAGARRASLASLYPVPIAREGHLGPHDCMDAVGPASSSVTIKDGDKCTKGPYFNEAGLLFSACRIPDGADKAGDVITTESFDFCSCDIVEFEGASTHLVDVGKNGKLKCAAQI
jgi:hypothetical protein